MNRPHSESESYGTRRHLPGLVETLRSEPKVDARAGPGEVTEELHRGRRVGDHVSLRGFSKRSERRFESMGGHDVTR